MTASSLIAALVLLVASWIAIALLGSEQARTRQALDEKTAALNDAERNLLVAADAIDRMLVRYATDAESHGDLHHAETFLTDASGFYARLLKRTKNPEIRRRAAQAYVRVGETQDLLGLYEAAKKSFRSAIETFRDLAAQSRDSEYDSTLAGAYNGLANAHLSLQEYDAAHRLFREVLTIREALAAAALDDVERQFALVIARTAPAFVYWQTGDLDDAERLYREALAVIESLPEELRQTQGVLTHWGTIAGNLALILRDRGDLMAGGEFLETAFHLHFSAHQLNHESRELQLNLYYVLWNSADFNLRRGRHRKAVEHIETFIRAFPHLLLAYVEGIELLQRAATLAEGEGAPPSPDPPPAEVYHGRARELLAASREADWTTPDSLKRMSWLLLSYPEEDLRDVPRAESLIQQALDQVPTRPDFHWTHAAAHYYAGDYEGALQHQKKGAALGEEDAWDWLLLAMIHAKRGDHDDAMRWFAKADTWIATHDRDDQLKRFRTEAASTIEAGAR